MTKSKCERVLRRHGVVCRRVGRRDELQALAGVDGWTPVVLSPEWIRRFLGY